MCDEEQDGFLEIDFAAGDLDRFDQQQEIARSAFADMCHDWERNQKYDRALQHTIGRLHAHGIEAHVLDIGTGSGLLSMMAVRAGADSVTACEAFRPMADCAEQVIRANGMAGKIRLVKKRSTAMVVGGENGDMERRANVLVTELFDTELIGEGAIATYAHALEHLLEKGCRVIPHSATIYAQLVECPLAMSWQVPRAISNSDGDVLLRTPEDVAGCRGSSAVFDVQLSQIPEGSFNALAKPIPVFKFDWSTSKGLASWRFTRLEVQPIKSGVPHAVFMWWDLKMDAEGTIDLSCAPFWAHPDHAPLKHANKNPCIPTQNVIPWRDHWMQAIYFLPQTKQVVSAGQSVFLNANHDEFSLWFSLDKPCVDPPHCSCGMHIAYSRSRIGQLNDGPRNKKILNYLEQVLDKNSVVLVLGDGSLLGAAMSAMGVGKVILLETTQISRKCMELYASFNGLKNIEILASVEELADCGLRNEITHIFGEPYFGSCILPWENAVRFGAAVQRVKTLLNPNVAIIPSSFSIHAVPVEFLDLHKINAPLGTCEGFDLSCMDRMIEEHSSVTDGVVEAQPLWEYPCFALEPPSELIAVSLTDGLPEAPQLSQGIMLAGSAMASRCNGVAIWADFHMDQEVRQKTTVSTGPLLPPVEATAPDEPIRWNANWRQGVHLLRRPLEGGAELHWSVKFNERLNACCFQFDRVGSKIVE